MNPERPIPQEEKSASPYEKARRSIDQIQSILADLGFEITDVTDRSLKENLKFRRAFPVSRAGIDGIRALPGRDGSITIAFTNGFENPENEDRQKITKALREQGFEVR
jgi:hypothetical protein